MRLELTHKFCGGACFIKDRISGVSPSHRGEPNGFNLRISLLRFQFRFRIQLIVQT